MQDSSNSKDGTGTDFEIQTTALLRVSSTDNKKRRAIIGSTATSAASFAA